MTSYQKRKPAVEYCIEHGKDYKATAANFDYTYQQVYGWMRLYHAGGLEKCLTDVTEFKYGDGCKAFLSAVLDIYGRNIVSFSLSRKKYGSGSGYV